MTTKEKLKSKIEYYNPIARKRRYRMQEQLKNRDITFLVPNCIGGILFHDLGLKFMSPTVNLMMTQTDFAKFVTHLDAYIAEEFVFFKHAEYTCPCAMLGDITIHFTHYSSEEEAKKKWIERVARINTDNMFVFCEERDGLSKENILDLGKIKARGIVVFTANDYPDIPYVLPIPKYKSNGEVGNILSRNYWDDSREYEQYFDFIKWFNEADGCNYDITPYKK